MANENLILTRSFQVSSDSNNLSAATDDFLFAHPSDANKRVSQAYVGDYTIGITQESRKKDEWVAVGVSGISKLRLGGTVVHGNLLKPDAQGRGVLHLGDTWAGAMALEDGASGETIEALIVNIGPAT